MPTTSDWVRETVITDLDPVEDVQIEPVDTNGDPNGSGCPSDPDWQGDLEITWTKTSTFDGEYEIYRRTLTDEESEPGTLLGTAEADSESFVDDSGDLEPGRRYEYTVRSVATDAEAEVSKAYWTSTAGLNASLYVEIDGVGDLETIEPPLQGLGNATLRHTALSNVDIETPHIDGLREYADVFADVELRVRLVDQHGEDIDDRRLWKGLLEEVESQGQADSMTLHTVGRGWYLDKDEALVEFESLRVSEAIEQYLDEETDFEAHVVPDPGSPVVTDELAWEASTTEEWEDALDNAADVPVIVADGALLMAQVCFTSDVRAVDLDDFDAPISSENDYSGGNKRTLEEQGQFLEFNPIDLEYTIPESEVGFACRIETDFQGPEVELSIIDDDDDSTIGTVALIQSGAASALNWWDTTFAFGPLESAEWEGGDLEPGSYRIRLDVVDSGEPDTEIGLDLMTIFDERFEDDLTWDNDVHESQGYLDGPEDYPAFVGAETELIERETQVEAVRVESEWTETTNQQSLGASNDGGQTYLTAENSDSLDVNFSEEDLFGSELRVQLGLSRADVGPQDATPRFGYESQRVASFEARFDQTSIAVINEAVLSETHLQNLKTLCGWGRYHFVIGHSADDRRIDAFPAGTPSPTNGAQWATKDWSRTDGSAEYANRVVARGARREDDTDDVRWEGVAEDSDEIERLLDLGTSAEKATVTRTLLNPEWDDQETVNQQAFAALEEAVDAARPSGTVEIVPTFIAPGYAYSVPEFETDDGEIPSKTLEQVSLSQSYGDASGSLEFEAPRNWVRALSPVERDVVGLKRLF